IESVLSSSNPTERFTEKNVDPNRFVSAAASLIANQGDYQALEEIGKLLRINEERFEGFVRIALSAALANQENVFVLIYRGLRQGSATLDARMMGWVESVIVEDIRRQKPGPISRQWAEAAVERYGGVPLVSEWANDPIVSRMKPETVELMRDAMFEAFAAAW